jgi:hypothetical protein
MGTCFTTPAEVVKSRDLVLLRGTPASKHVPHLATTFACHNAMGRGDTHSGLKEFSHKPLKYRALASTASKSLDWMISVILPRVTSETQLLMSAALPRLAVACVRALGNSLAATQRTPQTQHLRHKTLQNAAQNPAHNNTGAHT